MHFTLSDVSENQFHFTEEVSRGSIGLAGAQANPYKVWLGKSFVEEINPGQYRLYANYKEIELNLNLVDMKGPILHGENGYSQKGMDAGNASFYFSQTRLESTGRIKIGGSEYKISGSSWMDHEFSTSALSADQIGWDWFSLQFENGQEIMLYTIRNADGSINQFSGGTMIDNNGNTRPLQSNDIQVSPLNFWKSPNSKAEYPSSWEISIPDENLNIIVTPLIQDQELRVSYTYWEGCVDFYGTQNGKPVSGFGYVELTGYADPMRTDF
jgi:predicted secreted hydrolase